MGKCYGGAEQRGAKGAVAPLHRPSGAKDRLSGAEDWGVGQRPTKGAVAPLHRPSGAKDRLSGAEDWGVGQSPTKHARPAQRALLLLLLLYTGCASTVDRRCEEVRALGQQLSALRGEIDNDLQVLAACAAHSHSKEAAHAAALGIFSIVGPPDANELATAVSLTVNGVKEVTDHGLSLAKQRTLILAKHRTASDFLIADVHRLEGRASAFSLVKFIALGGGLAFLLFLSRRIF